MLGEAACGLDCASQGAQFRHELVSSRAILALGDNHWPEASAAGGNRKHSDKDAQQAAGQTRRKELMIWLYVHDLSLGETEGLMFLTNLVM